MKILVIGGTGLIGNQLVKLLKQDNHEVVAGSPSTGIDTLTGEGLEAALKNASVVIDVSNAPSFEEKAVMDFFKTSSDNLLKAEKTAGVQHHIALSVVGTKDLQASGYFRAKQKQEDLIQASGIPYTIVHATQFFEFAAGIVAMSIANEKIVLPDANIQPIASSDVVKFLAGIVTETPANTILEIGGPEKFAMKDWIGNYLKAAGKNLQIIADKNALYSGALIEADTLNPRNAGWTGISRYADWVAAPGNLR